MHERFEQDTRHEECSYAEDRHVTEHLPQLPATRLPPIRHDAARNAVPGCPGMVPQAAGHPSRRSRPCSPPAAAAPGSIWTTHAIKTRAGTRKPAKHFRRFPDIAQELPTHYDIVVNTDVLTGARAVEIVVSAPRIARLTRSRIPARKYSVAGGDVKDRPRT